MKAVIYDKKSSSERLIYSEVDKPVPKDDEVLIKIRASSINAADYRMMQLGFPPKSKIFGADVSGIVESAGKNVNKFKEGDCVAGDLSDFGFGGFAEYVCAPEKVLAYKPEQLSFEEAAALPLAATTALQALRNKGEVKKDDEVLIIGCSGGVGTYAVQIAKYYGATVTGICSSRNEKSAYSIGSDYVINYNKVNIKQLDSKYDLILGINGNYPLRTCKKLLNANGRYIMVGGSYRQIIKSILFTRIMSLGSKKMNFLSAANTDNNDIEFILKLVSDGKIKPVIDKVYNLNETAEAAGYIKDQHAKGKVIIKVK